MPLPNAYQSTDRFSEWSEKDKQEYWDKKEKRRKEAEDKKLANYKNNKEHGDSSIFGLNDNDGW
jgi:hypothetical protein